MPMRDRSPLSVSVVIVSRCRPEALLCCLRGCAQLRYDTFEIVVVTDPGSLAQVSKLPFAHHLKTVAFDAANVSAARNEGVRSAAGEIIAFIDDDAVPEPSWLHHLIGPFSDRHVAAAGGFVRGRNGISYQWRANTVDQSGQVTTLTTPDDAPMIITPSLGRVAKTEGTNMAIRRSVLAELGGFDPAFQFFLDETDLNLRLGQAGHAVALVPHAQVHHGFAASARRRPDRVPRSLHQIGASWAVFQRKHMEASERVQHWNYIRASERKRALSYLISGHLDPSEVRGLMRSLDAGYVEGKSRDFGYASTFESGQSLFRRFPTVDSTPIYLSCRHGARHAFRRKAAALAETGAVVTLVILSHTALFHHMRFHPMGFWEQTGGLFGKSVRNQKLVTMWCFAKRVDAEIKRIKKVRNNFADAGK